MMRRVLALSLVALAACDIPSGIPNWDTTWNVPSQSLTVGVGQVLPSGVSVSPDGSAFLVSVAPVTMSERLADDCPACVAGTGLLVPKPAFQARVTSGVVFPADLQGGVLAAGARIDFEVTNGNTFDPLHPTAGVNGWVTFVVRSGTTVLARDSVNGATASLPAGGQLTRNVTLGGGAVVREVTIDVVLDSPAGDAVRIDAARSVEVTATPSLLRVTQATFAVRGAAVSQSVGADLDVSNSLSDRVQSGRLLIAVKDPFAVHGPLAVRLSASGAATITKSLDVVGGDKDYTLQFTRDEMRSLLGRAVTITVAGPVSATGMLTVTPAQAIAIGTRFELVLNTND